MMINLPTLCVKYRILTGMKQSDHYRSFIDAVPPNLITNNAPSLSDKNIGIMTET